MLVEITIDPRKIELDGETLNGKRRILVRVDLDLGIQTVCWLGSVCAATKAEEFDPSLMGSYRALEVGANGGFKLK